MAAVLRGRASLGSKGSKQGAAGELLLRSGEQALIDASGEAQRVFGKRLTHEIDWARELLAPEPGDIQPIRRGNLLARVPRWTGQLGPSPEWPLAVRRMVVDVHVEDGHVRTTIDQTFFNHVDRTLEGVYQFPLPPEAAISRLAMYVDGKRMEAGVVERDRGRDIYEQIVHRRRDPALLEWMRGNLFQVRIFPLPARTEKRVLLSYTQSLDELYGRGSLRVPIPEIDLPVGEVVYRVRVVGGAGSRFVSQHQEFEVREEGGDLLAEFTAADHVIGADIVAELGDEAEGEGPRVVRLRDQGDAGAGSGEYMALRLRPDLSSLVPAVTDAPARDLVVLFDTSASRGVAELEAQRRFLLALLDHLDEDDRIAVQAFDSRPRWFAPELQPLARLDREALATFLEEEGRLGRGTTELGAAIDAGIEQLAALAGKPNPGDAFSSRRERLPTLLYLGDGLDTTLSNEEAAARIDGRAAELAGRIRGQAHFAAVSFGAGQDRPLLESLAAAGDGLHLHVDERDSLSWRALELLTILATPRVLELEARLLDAEGAVVAEATTHADRLAIADGERLELLTLLSAADLEQRPTTVELRGVAANVTVDEPQEWSQRFELPPAPEGDSRWIPRAWARAHVAALSKTGADIEANSEEITKLGLEHFLVTPTTSLLVLENER
ncbi:MAG: VWA domain-containing protein, partial [Myxococcales bacterium]|nr:VWA domain-containing protein [Myxococcales bacterium]